MKNKTEGISYDYEEFGNTPDGYESFGGIQAGEKDREQEYIKALKEYMIGQFPNLFSGKKADDIPNEYESTEYGYWAKIVRDEPISSDTYWNNIVIYGWKLWRKER